MKRVLMSYQRLEYNSEAAVEVGSELLFTKTFAEAFPLIRLLPLPSSSVIATSSTLP
jgi:hypothetical protein